MENKVKGKGLGSTQTVETETSQSSYRKDRRRDNDDSKHEHKVKMEEERIAKQREANEMLRQHPMQNPYMHHEAARSLYTGPAFENLQKMECGWPSSTPSEKLIPLKNHTHPEDRNPADGHSSKA
jgi:hypothetical protein